MPHAVIALDVDCPTLDLREPMRGTARRFEPHVTLLPRFVLAPRHEGRAFEAAVASATRDPIGVELAMEGPRWAEADLAWYECAERNESRAWPAGAHQRLLAEELASGRIGEPPHFSGCTFHPHMSVFWRSDDPLPDAWPSRLRLFGRAVSLYTYPSDPHRDPVRRQVLLSQTVV